MCGSVNAANAYVLAAQLAELSWPAVHAYDAGIVGGEPRQNWLRLWLSEHPMGVGRVALHSATDAIVGYGQICEG
jgi:hypothetical protein